MKTTKEPIILQGREGIALVSVQGGDCLTPGKVVIERLEMWEGIAAGIPVYVDVPLTSYEPWELELVRKEIQARHNHTHYKTM